MIQPPNPRGSWSRTCTSPTASLSPGTTPSSSSQKPRGPGLASTTSKVIARAPTETLNENLPGFPDNIHYSTKGDILYVGIIRSRAAILDLMWKSPFLKSLLALYSALQDPFDTTTRLACLLAMDENGSPLEWYQDPSGKMVGYITTAAEVDGFLCLGGLRDDFVGRIRVWFVKEYSCCLPSIVKCAVVFSFVEIIGRTQHIARGVRKEYRCSIWLFLCKLPEWSSNFMF